MTSKSSKHFFTPVDARVSFPKLEEEVLSFWEKDDTFRKTVEKNKGKKAFVFYEGPPTANGKPGIHHVESRSFKDIVPRYKTMCGFYCERKAGWDCHGLPVELEVEKKLGISGKPDIEKLGIEEFCKLCRESVFEYVEEWSRLTKRIGYWVDLDNAYETMDNNYIESEWHILGTLWDKGLLYEDYKVVPYCTRCGTSLSSHELAQGYKDDVEDPSVYVKFKVKSADAKKGEENKYFVAWTTTPWTLPGNVALAVSEKDTYVEISTENGNLILAEKRAEALEIKGKVVKKYKGKELLGLEYEPLYSFVSYDKKAHFVVASDFVSMEDGTGIVHTAVMYGEDDFRLGKANNLPQKHLVNEKGHFIEEVTPWAGMFVKKADKEIIKDLEDRGLMLKAETIKHTYPFCWRCSSPLLYYAMTSWYLKTTDVKDRLVANNKSVNWLPEHIKDGRMGEWLENNRDWALSRSRYWGTPLPVWECDSCDHKTVVRSVSELGKLAGRDMSKLDLHRPFIDEVKFACLKCKEGTMTRVPFVLDCWFDSGAMPMAAWHYPFENKDKFEANYPADYISEAIDQTRGWFYTLQGVAALLGNSTAYENVICLGHVLDENGNKMSKSKGNVVNPWSVMDEVGADAARWYFYSATTPGPSFRFSSNLVKDVTKRFMLILWNSYNYFVTYANLNGWKPGIVDGKLQMVDSDNVLDKWVVTRLQELVNQVTENMDKYDLFNSTQLIESFVTKDFSQWYIRRSRGRTDDAFFATSHKVLTTISQIIAPFAPFVSDAMYRNLVQGESVHMADWPESKELSEKDTKILSEMNEIRNVVQLVHSIRQKENIPVRQPLQFVFYSFSLANDKFDPLVWMDLLKDELNVKDVVWSNLPKQPVHKGKWVSEGMRKSEGLGDVDVSLQIDITPELLEEGKTRDLIRKIQEERKTLNIDLKQEIEVTAVWLPESEHLRSLLKEKTLAKNISQGEFKVTPL